MRSKANLVLLELLIVLLFFALSATVMLRLFAGAYSASRESRQKSDLLLAAQDWAERLYACEEPAALLQEGGFCEADGLWTLDGAEGRLCVRLSEAESGAGRLRDIRLSALNPAGEAVLTLPVCRYLPGEAAG